LTADITPTPRAVFKELLELINKANLPEAQRQRAVELVKSLKTHLAISDEVAEDAVDASRKYEALRDDLSNLSSEYNGLDKIDAALKIQPDSAPPSHHP
jgi:hypothetical protein